MGCTDVRPAVGQELTFIRSAGTVLMPIFASIEQGGPVRPASKNERVEQGARGRNAARRGYRVPHSQRATKRVSLLSSSKRKPHPPRNLESPAPAFSEADLRDPNHWRKPRANELIVRRRERTLTSSRGRRRTTACALVAVEKTGGHPRNRTSGVCIVDGRRGIGLSAEPSKATKISSSLRPHASRQAGTIAPPCQA